MLVFWFMLILFDPSILFNPNLPNNWVSRASSSYGEAAVNIFIQFYLLAVRSCWNAERENRWFLKIFFPGEFGVLSYEKLATRFSLSSL